MTDSHEDYAEIRDAVRKLCAYFPGEYWRKLDAARSYPTEFVTALTKAGYLSVLIPEDSGGAGETRLYQVAPISTNLILSYLVEHCLGLPRSY